MVPDRWLPFTAVGLSVLALRGVGWIVSRHAPAAGVGDPLPDLTGNPVSPEALSGQRLLVNIGATWCGPCREEMPWRGGSSTQTERITSGGPRSPPLAPHPARRSPPRTAGSHPQS